MHSLIIIAEYVQCESSGRSTHVALPFVAKRCVPVMFWVFNHREVHLAYTFDCYNAPKERFRLPNILSLVQSQLYICFILGEKMSFDAIT